MLANRRIRNTWASCLAGLALLAAAAGCGGSGGDKAGGDDDVEARVLTLANPNGEPPAQLITWADEVDRLSGGTLEIEFENDWRQGEADYEAATIEDIQASEVDVAWVGARAFDTVGVTTFQALVAPLLIDSHDLQEAVFEAGIPTEMLAGLEAIDLTGIGVLPGPMRKVLGIEQPFVSPADFDGAVVGIQQSGVADQAMAALGATTMDLPTGASLDGVDAYEQQPASIAGNAYWRVADYVTANVNLWPRPLVMFINTDVFDSLSEEQQQALTDAAAAAIPGALDASRTEDRDGAAENCRSEMTTVVATDEELNALRTAFEPIYEAIAADPATGEHLEAITAIKDELGAPADGAECAPSDVAAPPVTAPTSSGEPTPLDGVYEVTTPETTWDCSGPACWGHIVWVFDRGRFAINLENELVCTWAYGTHEVLGDRFAMTFIDGGGSDPLQANRPGELFVFGWHLEDDLLTLSPVAGEASPDPALGEPWQRTSTTPNTDAFSTNCPPPPEALPELSAEGAGASSAFPEGTFHSLRQPSDGQPDCPAWSTATSEDELGQMQLIFNEGEVVLSDADGTELNSETYEVFRDRVEITHEISARWSFDGTSLTFSDIEAPDGTELPCDVQIMWAARPWVLVSEDDAPEAQSTAFPEGRFETTITDEDWPSTEAGGTTGTFTMVIDGGALTVLQPETDEIGFEGDYTVFEDRIEVSDGVETITARWALDGDQLVFSDVEPAASPFEVVWGSHPWDSIGNGEETAGIDGTYQWTLLHDDAVDSGTIGPDEEYPSTFTAELRDGEWSMSQSTDPETAHGTYSVFRDNIVFEWVGGPTLEFTFLTDDDGNLTLTAVEPMDPGDRFVWSFYDWIRVD